MFLGLPEDAESEGFDRASMDLPAAQVELVRRVAAVRPRTIVVLANGAPVRLDPWDTEVAAILECWLSGQAAGGAVADLIFGMASPSGRLAETLPVSASDCPAALNFPGDSGRVRYGEGVFVGYRGYDRLDRPVSYPFGHGLTYTEFAYRDLMVDVHAPGPVDELRIEVSMTLHNIGGRPGAEVVQLYVGAPDADVARPPRELRAFAKHLLEPGVEATVEFELRARDLSYWSAEDAGWVLRPGTFAFEVGASSRDIRLRTTRYIPAPPRQVRLTPESTLYEWLASPRGAELLAGAVNGSGLLKDKQLLRVIGDFPMGVLATFPGVGFDRALVDKLVQAADGTDETR